MDIKGTSPLVINKFSAKAQAQMEAKQMAGQAGKTRRSHDAKDFESLYNECRHISSDGWDGFHAAAIRNACISACRAAGYTMTKAKLALFVVADGFDRDDGTPLIRINGEPKMVISQTRNQTGVIDLRPRAHFMDWSATVTLQWDNGMLTQNDVVNLLARVGFRLVLARVALTARTQPDWVMAVFSRLTQCPAFFHLQQTGLRPRHTTQARLGKA